MNFDHLLNITRQFISKTNEPSFQVIGDGHIHDTYKISTAENSKEYILQKINNSVFLKPDVLVANHTQLYLDIKEHTDKSFKIPAIYPLISGQAFLYYDKEGNPWRMTESIHESYTIQKTAAFKEAYEAGKAYGWFIKVTDRLVPSSYTLSIPNFHDLSFRLSQLDEAIENDRAKRKMANKNILDFFIERRDLLSDLVNLIDTGELPVRITHNDTKINNVLFRGKRAVAVIDLDTVGPGIVYYDYGDALRTIANRSVEDEKDFTKSGLNKDAFEAFTRGFLEYTGSILNEMEIRHLHMAPLLMSYIMGIRFLTDFLNGDVYYKIKYTEHNLIRTLVQKSLIESIEQNQDYMKNFINSTI
jgi:hypothetical protein